ncbi:hypothetical protein CEXT_706711 [Caerostris extrusa]|uniref:Uncharacterized protein n=1 Tax=Caerostris extrusa TaxID=172846 RepID=A0AAV4PUY6_CAEEX|nr:hypothetical protein CEXT_706711 [Caerostris extrusa]
MLGLNLPPHPVASAPRGRRSRARFGRCRDLSSSAGILVFSAPRSTGVYKSHRCPFSLSDYHTGDMRVNNMDEGSLFVPSLPLSSSLFAKGGG